jgi:hypothetical protein
MNRQPWVNCSNPLAPLWVNGLRQAIADGFVSREKLQVEVDKGHVRPSLIEQIDAGIDSPMQLTQRQRDLDRGFVPPYHSLRFGRTSPWLSPMSALQFGIARLGQRFKFIDVKNMLR